MIGYSSSRPSGTAGSSPWAARARSTSAWLEVDLMMDFEICVDEGHGHFSRPKQKNGTEIMHIFTQERLQVACVRMGQKRKQTCRQRDTWIVSRRTQERELKWTKKVTKRGGPRMMSRIGRTSGSINNNNDVNRLNRDPV